MSPRSQNANYRSIFMGAAGVLIVVVVAGAYFFMSQGGDGSRTDADDPKLVARGHQVYEEACASCHGENLEGQPDWWVRLANGRLPAPPHDATGHTWHHPDELLFGMTKIGIQASTGLDGYGTDMPAFKDVLSDEEIWAVLAYIKSTWPPKYRARQEDIN